MAIATMTESCPGVEQSSIQGGKLPSSSRSIKSGAMHLAPAPDIKELSNFLLLERSSIQVCKDASMNNSMISFGSSVGGDGVKLALSTATRCRRYSLVIVRDS